jgi:hypothetical protein
MSAHISQPAVLQTGWIRELALLWLSSRVEAARARVDTSSPRYRCGFSPMSA